MPPRRGVTTTSSRCGLPATIGAAAGSTRYVRCASGNRWRRAAMAGVVKTTSPICRRRTNRIFNLPSDVWRSRLDRRLVDEHDRNVVLDRVYALAGVALESGAVFHEHDRCL